MKKVILTVTTVVLATIAVHAQSAGAEVRIMSQSWRGAFAKNQARQAEAATKIRKSNLAARVTQQVQRQQAQQTLACGTATQAPAQPVARKPANTTPRGTTTAAAPANKGSVKQWLKAIFLGGRFPGESADAYHHRLTAQSQPASLPFK